MPNPLQDALNQFTADKGFRGKGPLCVALVVTQHARTMGLPLDPDKLLTERGGQVYGLGKGAVQAILAKHGIERVLAAENHRFEQQRRGNADGMIQPQKHCADHYTAYLGSRDYPFIRLHVARPDYEVIARNRVMTFKKVQIFKFHFFVGHLNLAMSSVAQMSRPYSLSPGGR